MDDLSNYQFVDEVRLNKLVVNLLGALFMLLLLALFMGIVFLLPHRVNVFDHMLVFYIALLPVLVFHEVLHAWAAIKYGKLSYADIKFGMNWKGLMPYCHISKPLTEKQYRIAGLMPLLVTGPASIGLVCLYPHMGSAMLASVAISICTGDLLMIFKLRPYRDNNLLVYDHPSEPGFIIYKLRDSDC